MAVKEFGEALDERPQALLLHHGNGLVIHAALPEERAGACPVSARSWFPIVRAPDDDRTVLVESLAGLPDCFSMKLIVRAVSSEFRMPSSIRGMEGRSSSASSSGISSAMYRVKLARS
ncbi:hypothetical protein [Myxococcus faecalis]|uniref:hypothetical protein n=1 Tax=Myxococcus faecalis TaxID=3115646 RepID=UPI003CF8FE95